MQASDLAVLLFTDEDVLEARRVVVVNPAVQGEPYAIDNILEVVHGCAVTVHERVSKYDVAWQAKSGKE